MKDVIIFLKNIKKWKIQTAYERTLYLTTFMPFHVTQPNK